VRLDRYILQQLLWPSLFFLTTLTGIVWVTQSLRSVDLIVNRGLSGGHFLLLTLLILPKLLVLILPVALFAGILYAYSRLSQERELVVMWSAGLSPLRLARPALKVAGVVTLGAYVLSFWLMPLGDRSFQAMKNALRSSLSHVLLQEGTFNSIGEALTVYIRERTASGELLGILVHDNREPGRPVTMMAASGALVRSDEGPRLVLVDGNRQMVDRSSGQLSFLYFDSYALDLSEFLPEDDRRWLEPSERYIHELFRPARSKDDEQHAARLWTEGHDRIVVPVFNLAFPLIALAALQVGQFQRRGQGWRIAIAIAAVLAVRLLQLGLANVAVRQPSLVVLMYLNAGLAIAVPLWLLNALPRFRPPGATMREPAAAS